MVIKQPTWRESASAPCLLQARLSAVMPKVSTHHQGAVRGSCGAWTSGLARRSLHAWAHLPLYTAGPTGAWDSPPWSLLPAVGLPQGATGSSGWPLASSALSQNPLPVSSSLPVLRLVAWTGGFAAVKPGSTCPHGEQSLSLGTGRPGQKHALNSAWSAAPLPAAACHTIGAGSGSGCAVEAAGESVGPTDNGSGAAWHLMLSCLCCRGSGWSLGQDCEAASSQPNTTEVRPSRTSHALSLPTTAHPLPLTHCPLAYCPCYLAGQG